MKDPRWKQANPADQFTVLRASLEGTFDNWRSGVIDTPTFETRCNDHLNQLYNLDSFLHGRDKW